ncbi:hypothetical protein Acr_24g0000680 [Actinidia rufa]|uniref:Plant invertase/pectin methylesterase inhibitor superfamily protein n=1 Tax=Actinidia rufa TaxID=165716 RepID=A0A7J0GSX8_9ERIC|nr:hypothetical protein Acr_24g0000680 [Actinidia rufa]
MSSSQQQPDRPRNQPTLRSAQLASLQTTSPFVSRLSRDVFKNTMDPDLFRFLGTCIGDYDQTVSSTLPQAIKALETNNYGAAKQGTEDAATSVQDCVDAIGGELPEIIKPDKLVQDLILVAKSIISTLG